MAYSETKFAEFNRMLEEVEAESVVTVAWPEVLGDDYVEVIENLSRLAEHHLKLAIARRRSQQGG